MRCQMVGTIVLLGLVLCIPWQSSAQISVIDTAHLVQNTISAVQNVEMVLNMLLELTPLDELILADGFREDLNTLAQLVNEASGMAWELTSLNAQFDQLFGTGALPDSSLGYALRRSEVAQLVLSGWRYAMQTQTLIKTALRTIDHLLRFIGQIAAVIGNLQVAQTVSQGQQQLAQLLTEANVTRAAFERARATEGADQASSIESLRAIHRNLMTDHPR